MEKKLTLHEAIVVVLSTKTNKSATTEVIADEINKRELYLRGNGTPVPAYQIMMRTNLSSGKYSHIFKFTKPNIVSLIGHL
jgi:hypothetical protein